MLVLQEKEDALCHYLLRVAQLLPPPSVQASLIPLSPSSPRQGARTAPQKDDAETMTHPRGGESGCSGQLVPESTFQYCPHPWPCPHAMSQSRNVTAHEDLTGTTNGRESLSKSRQLCDSIKSSGKVAVSFCSGASQKGEPCLEQIFKSASSALCKQNCRTTQGWARAGQKDGKSLSCISPASGPQTVKDSYDGPTAQHGWGLVWSRDCP